MIYLQRIIGQQIDIWNSQYFIFILQISTLFFSFNFLQKVANEKNCSALIFFLSFIAPILPHTECQNFIIAKADSQVSS